MTRIVSMSAATSFFSASTCGGPGGVGAVGCDGALPRPRCAATPAKANDTNAIDTNAFRIVKLSSLPAFPALPAPPALPALRRLSGPRRRRRGRGAPVVNAVEQQLE